MIHDPLCNWSTVTCSDGSLRNAADGPCLCDVLAEAERRGIVRALEAVDRGGRAEGQVRALLARYDDGSDRA